MTQGQTKSLLNLDNLNMVKLAYSALVLGFSYVHFVAIKNDNHYKSDQKRLKNNDSTLLHKLKKVQLF